MPVEYLDPEIAGEGVSVNNWQPGAWTNAPNLDEEEFQPEVEPPRIPDYAGLKKHKHYKQYFRPYRYQPFPAFMYHAELGEKIVKSKDEVIKLGPGWYRHPVRWYHAQLGERIITNDAEIPELGNGWTPISRASQANGPGKSLPVKSDTEKLTETLVATLAAKPGVDPSSIAAIVAAVVAATQAAKPAPQRAERPAPIVQDEPAEMPLQDDALAATERDNLLALATERGIKVDGRWGNDRIKKELGLE